MASATYFQRGESLDYVNKTEAVIEAGEILVIGTKVGVAGCDIPVGGTGSVHMTGVFAMPKGTGAIAMGASVEFASGAIKAATGSTVHGYCAKAAESGDTVVYVKLIG